MSISAEAPLPIDIDWELAKERVQDSGRKLVGLMRSVVDPSRTAIGYWTIGDLSAHLTQVYEGFPVMAAGGKSPVPDEVKMAQTYDDYLRENPERDPASLADRVEKSTIQLLEQVQNMSPQDSISWHGGIEIPIVVLLAIVVDEAIVHGWDIAQAEGREARIAPVDAQLSIKGLTAVSPHFLTPEGKAARVSYGIKLRGDGRLTVRLANGEATVSSYDEGPVDCRITASPVDFLMVGAGRIGMWGPIAKGKIVAYGRKPWKGLNFTKYFRDP